MRASNTIFDSYSDFRNMFLLCFISENLEIDCKLVLNNFVYIRANINLVFGDFPIKIKLM